MTAWITSFFLLFLFVSFFFFFLSHNRPMHTSYFKSLCEFPQNFEKRSSASNEYDFVREEETGKRPRFVNNLCPALSVQRDENVSGVKIPFETVVV